ncbi:MAG: ferric reductase-like transmembrane domain-containing protein [Siculibacillus sp.]|nr:ferric reductase-like transmembrane domain-containing protein [Siculibacillus sp.]
MRTLAPWIDRGGRPSLLRGAVFLLLWWPALDLARRWAVDDLGARPLAEAIHVAGDWAVRLLVLAVAITPLRHLSGATKLIGVRRMIGLAAAGYTLLHVTLWAGDLGFEFRTMAFEIAVRPYLGLGFAAALGLAAMAATSTDGMVRRLGAERWKRLHRLVHPILILALVHLFLQSKLDLAQGAILTGLAFAGLAVRLHLDRRSGLGWATVAIAAVTAFVFATASEAVWFALKTGRHVGPLLEANFVFAARIAPAWWSAAIAAGTASGAAAFAVRHRRGTAAVAAGSRRSR